MKKSPTQRKGTAPSTRTQATIKLREMVAKNKDAGMDHNQAYEKAYSSKEGKQLLEVIRTKPQVRR
ncbi:MAG: hypothetical protein ACPGSB_03485 [Opitutales bacterium]